MGSYVGLIACLDRPGLVHQLTGVLFKRRFNLTENQEYVDHGTGRFFMRTQFEGEVDCKEIEREMSALLPENAFCQVRAQKSRRLVVLASRELHCLGDLLVRHYTRELPAEILSVVSQHDDCAEMVKRFTLPFHHIPYRGDRVEHEERVLKIVVPLQPDYLVLARYMRIFSPGFVNRFPGRIINIHHSFLPAFIGRDPYQQAYERGVKIIGATCHFVTAGLDQGPIITQDILPVDHSCLPDSMARKGQDAEKVALARGLNLALEDRILIDGNRTIVFA
jgi:formyltetrahydrofolate deformylase